MSYNKFRRDKIPFTLYRLIRTPTCDCPGREQHVGVPAKQGGLNDYAKKECIRTLFLFEIYCGPVARKRTTEENP